MVKAKEGPQLDAALEEMIRQIERGGEFPDVAYRVATKFKVDQSALERAYDSKN